ncbi:DGQHR domain-containing protein [Bacillus sp. 1021]|uniref:DNA sulfur modification protein DndB n=1 Tax=Bacillus sp. 1021 TaxID=2770510 RepID=UPI00165F7A84|nr:DNA sulfur modification protein DndB [Bacillus sp. 1021]MBD0408418.1 DGQHR domain-containing protein [Bacillus sp. 1021]
MSLRILVEPESNFITMFGLKGKQFGYDVISCQCTVDYILKFLDVDKSVQREIAEKQVSNISKYIQYGMEGNDIYFPPLIFSARGKGKFEHDKSQFHLHNGEKMVILDGQHRIEAFKTLKKRIEVNGADPKKLEYINEFPLTIQIYSDLNKKQERQLFTDVNTKSSKVSNTLLIMYKDNDLNGKIVKEIINDHPSISPDKFEIRAQRTTTKLMTASTLYNIGLALNDGTLQVKNNTSKINKENFSEYKKRLEDFLTLLLKYAPSQALDRDKYFILNPYVLQGIARCIYSLRENNNDFNMETFFLSIFSNVDWTHKNKELKQLGIPFNPKTNKYRFTVGTRTAIRITNMLLQKV